MDFVINIQANFFINNYFKFKIIMVKGLYKINLIFILALVYTLLVSFTLQENEHTRVNLYRILNAIFIILILAFNYNFVINSIPFLLKYITEKFKEILGLKEEVVKEDKTRAFIE